MGLDKERLGVMCLKRERERYICELMVLINKVKEKKVRILKRERESVIHQNGTSPSECRLSLCRRTKGHLWIDFCLEYYSLDFMEYISAFVSACDHFSMISSHVGTS